MKNFWFLLPCAAISGGALFSSLAFAQPNTQPPTGASKPSPIKRPPPPKGKWAIHDDKPVPLPHPHHVLRGEAQFRERIAISPNSKLHVALVGRVAGAEYLPIASGIFPARNGVTPFELHVPIGMAPTGPYRLQAWIVSDNRLMFNGLNPVTTIESLDAPATIMLKRYSARPVDIDGIGDGKTLPEPPGAVGVIEGVMPMIALTKGQIMKMDRRALLPDAEVEVIISDVSRVDAPAEVLAQRKFSLEGKQLPFSFEIPVRVDKRMMKPSGRYSISAKIYEAGKLTYATDTFTGITPQNAMEPFELLVKPIR